ncbi:MAG TPA: hypothetical protein VIP27_04350 [Variovorax sp.]
MKFVQLLGVSSKPGRFIQIKDSIEIEGTLFIERLKSVEAQQAFAGFLNKQSR